MDTKFGLHESIIDHLTKISSRTANIRKLILFGSRAKGNFKYNSDIDLAIESTGPISSQYYLDMEDAAELYKLDLLDIAMIKEELMLYEIGQGIILFER